MNKTELTEAVAEKTGLAMPEAGGAVDALLAVVTEELAAGGELKLPGFGTFAVRERPERRGRNPSTGETMELPPSKILIFRPGKTLKDTVND